METSVAAALVTATAASRGGHRAQLRRADELAVEGKTGEEIAAELAVSPATPYNWRRAYGGMDTDAAKEVKELRERNSRLKRLLAEGELEKDALREVAKDRLCDRLDVIIDLLAGRDLSPDFSCNACVAGC